MTELGGLKRSTGTLVDLEETYEGGQWLEISQAALERIPIPYHLVVLIVSGLVLVEQLFEARILGYPQIIPDLREWVAHFAIPVLTVYMLFIIRLLRHQTVEALQRLRPSVRISDEEYEDLARRMVSMPPLIETFLLLVAAGIVYGLFVFLGNSLPMSGILVASAQPARAVFVLLTYVLVGWIGMTLVWIGVRHAVGLRDLATRPLEVNAFDPENLLPFGNLSLLHSMTLVGVIVILSVPLGRPTSLGAYTVIVLSSVASGLTLFLPIWGVHRQIMKKKEEALSTISGQLMGLQQEIQTPPSAAKRPINEVMAHANTLIGLKKMIQEAPSWPFRSTTAVLRAGTAAVSPLIYFVLIELTRAYFVPVLIR